MPVLIDEFADPMGQLGALTGIIEGPDARIWIASPGTDLVGRIEPVAADPAASMTAIAAPPDVRAPFDVKPGPGGTLWFTNRGAPTIGRVRLTDDHAARGTGGAA